MTVDTTAPTIGAISEASNNATTTLAKAGNTITASFTSTDTVSGVTIGGQAATVVKGSGNNYTATYVVQQSDDGKPMDVVVNAVDTAGNTSQSTLSTGLVSVDTVAPSVLAANLLVTNNDAVVTDRVVASGETITAIFTPTDSDIASVSFDFSQFGGTTLAASKIATGANAGKWSAAYTLTNGNIDASGKFVSTIVKDNAGNVVGPVNSTTTFIVDNVVGQMGASPSTSVTNLLSYSQNFENSVWGKANITIASDDSILMAPDGTFTADKVQVQAAGGATASRWLTAPDSQFTYSVYVHKGSASTDLNVFGVYNATTSQNILFGNINLDNGAVQYSAGTAGISTVSVGNGWYRVSLSPVSGVSAGNTIAVYYGSAGQSQVAGAYSYVWGAQLVTGTSAAAYIGTTNSTATSDAILNAYKLVNGFSLKVDASLAQPGDKVQVGLYNSINGITTWGYTSDALSGATTQLNLNVNDGSFDNLSDSSVGASYQIVTRLVDIHGNLGVASTGQSITLAAHAQSMSNVTPSLNSTNNFTYSQSFDNSAWYKPSNVVVTADDLSIAAPDGSYTAEKISVSATTNTTLVRAINATSSSITYSLYVHKGSSASDLNIFAIYNATTGKNVVSGAVNLDNGSVTYTSGSSGISAVAATNGWYRIVVSPSGGVSSGDSLYLYYGSSGAVQNAGAYSYVWGAQLEAGVGASGYVPTNASPVTADNILSAYDLANGFSVKIDASAARLGDKVQVGIYDSVSGTTTWGYTSDALSGAVSQLNLTVKGSAFNVLSDTGNGSAHNYSLVTRLQNELGVGQTSLGQSVTIAAHAQSMTSITPTTIITNNLSYSQSFDNGVWPTTTNVAKVADTTNLAAPDGTFTAEKIQVNSTAATTLMRVATASSSDITYSLYVHKGSSATDLNIFSIYNVTASKNIIGGSVNLDTGAVSYSTGTIGIAATGIGNGWYRVSLHPISGISSGDTLYLYYGSSGATFSAGAYSYVWGAQLENGSGASSYIPTSTVSMSSDSTITAAELANGFGVKVDASMARVGDKVQVGIFDTVTGTTTWGYTSEALSGPVAQLNLNVKSSAFSSLIDTGDGTQHSYQLITRLHTDIDDGLSSATGQSITINTTGGQIINLMNDAVSSVRGGTGNDVITSNAGSHLIDITQGGSDTIKYNLILPGTGSSATNGGHGIDTLVGFSTAALNSGGDVIDLTGLITDHTAAVITGTSSSANDQLGRLKLDISGSTATLSVDYDGSALNSGSNGYATLLTFSTQSTDATVLLNSMLTNKNLVI